MFVASAYTQIIVELLKSDPRIQQKLEGVKV